MRGRKNLILTILSLMASLIFAITVIAAEQTVTPQEIKKISLKVSQNKSGEITNVLPREEGYTVTFVTDQTDLYVGEKPIAQVTVTAKSGYIFMKDFDRSSHFSISGGRFFEGERLSQSVVYVEIECNTRVQDKLETPIDLEWYDDRGLATWTDVEGADYYKVKVNGTELDYRIYNNYVDLSSYIKFKKNNRFQVRAFSDSDYLKTSSWSEKSDELYFEDYDEWNENINHNNNYQYPNSPNNYPNGNYGGNNNYSSIRNEWVKLDNIWYYYDTNGYKLTGGMYRIGNSWYIFNRDGKMLTGWQKYDGRQYYFTSSGARAHGWCLVNGAWFYLDPETGVYVTNSYVYENGKVYYVSSSMIVNKWHDGRYFKYNKNTGHDGAMLRNCWDYINGSWYYFGDNGYVLTNNVYQINGSTYKFGSDGRLLIGWFDYNGASYYIKPNGYMARDEFIDGYYVDGKGRWIR